MNKSESIKELATALAKAQGELENATKDTANPFFKTKYADLATVMNTCRPILSKHGISITQIPSYEDGIASVDTLMMHSSGEWLSGVSSAPVGKLDPQGVGSATTYLRRYSYAAAAGIAQEDDDGNHSSKSQSTKVTVKSVPRQAMDALNPEEQEQIKAIANTALEFLDANQVDDAWMMIDNLNLEDHAKIALWSLFPAKYRSALKAATERLRQPA